MSRIPLVLIAGFLGAGKTTFLRALMGSLEERNIGFSVVVNDFENAEVDAIRLRSFDAEVQSINGSCVCCSSLNEFMQTLGDIEVPQGGVLLVEVNGASDLISLIAAITVRYECHRFTSPLQITMIDAQRWQRRGQHNELEHEQVQTSTHYMITHSDGADKAGLKRLHLAVQAASPRATETSADRMAEYLRFLCASSRFGSQENTTPLPLCLSHPAEQPHHHHHEDERAFTSMRVDLPFVVRRGDLEQALRDLPEEVVRVKGLCRLAELPTVPMSFQHVRPRAETWFLPMLGAVGIVPTGVIIGVGLPASQISSQFDRLPSAELLPEFKP
ncbi:GTP-binding protein [Prosthecobacter sp. SYSU 5D2]|uniref:CobW family GTP-binding protein n=1 Tax=Prosthecobacter sp. SYSU 5D2 TaxID=3134134 RepID=UPI0031FE786F